MTTTSHTKSNTTSNNNTNNRLQFLWNASHILLPTVPNLSAYYMQQFHQNAAEKNLILADGIKRTYCSYCGNIFIPGINSQIRVINKIDIEKDINNINNEGGEEKGSKIS
ncbi:11980_t:CDS:2 [Diversispora eburnea]|uniref:11980_t:CDS:1 n=1 Tax=Diversispora eburnea TaxID=1213867 RepID=A0A9N9G0Z2_9GLOM|nr:11980_t:CDS:2 [Diversispora eburnea]